MFFVIKMTSSASRYIGSGAVLCFVALMSSAFGENTAKRHHHVAHFHVHSNAPKPAEKTAVQAVADDQLTASDLLHRLPPSWRATLLDPPQETPKAGTGQSKNAASAPQAPSVSAGASSSATSDEGASTDRILLPIPARAGIAAFKSGDRFVIVIDNALPMDTSAIHGSGIFSSLTVSLLPDATLIQVRISDTRHLYLSRQSNGWVLGDQPPLDIPAEDKHVINPLTLRGGVLYPMRRSGRVLTVRDPASGERLLVGTSLLDDGGIMAMRHADGYDVWPTTEGVVIAARDPDINLVAVPSGLLLNRDGRDFEDDGQAVFANDVDLQWLALQDLPDQALRQRYRDSLVKAADSKPADRFARRIEAAQAAFSMGAFTEARGILSVALRDDPEEIARPEVRFLTSATALMTGDTDEASALDGPWPERQQRAVQLWRALYLDRMNKGDERSVHRLALDLDRLRSYPAGIREILLPAASEAIARLGAPADMATLGRLPEQAPYQLARALADQRQGKLDRARGALVTLSVDRDPVISEKAAEARIMLDFRRGTLTPQQTVRALDEIVLDARLAGRERELRLSQAEAFLRAKQWQNATLIIDQGAPPDEPSAYTARRTALLRQALIGLAAEPTEGTAKDNQLRIATLLKAHIPALPAGQDRTALSVAYGKTLLSLGLAEEAAQSLSTILPAVEDTNAKAEAGAALAQAYILRNDPTQALAALDTSDAPSLPHDLQAQRDILKAKIALMKGDQMQGFAILKNTQGTAARLMSARLFEKQGDWAGAAKNLQNVATQQIPADGPLSDSQQDLAVRLTADAARAGDTAMLQWISDRIGARSLDGMHAQLFNALKRQPGYDAALADTGASP